MCLCICVYGIAACLCVVYLWVSLCVCAYVCVNSDPPRSPQFAFLETIVTAVTDEFPYYLRPKKAVFSGLICVAMYLMGLVLTTDVSAAAGTEGHRGGEARPGACPNICDYSLGYLLLPCWKEASPPQALYPRAAWPMTQNPGFKVEKTWLQAWLLHLRDDLRTSGFAFPSLFSHQ